MKKKWITEHSVIFLKLWKNALFICILMLLVVFHAVAQRQVTGKVTDSKGGPLPGVTVVVKGTTQGTITSAEGTYFLTDIPGGAVLSFSFVGMHSQEIVVGNRTDIDVVMEEETIGLEEVVAIGYGTVKKTDLTGSVATVQGQTLAERRNIKAAESLQGALSGVQVTRSGDAPDTDPSIRIRGITTIGDSGPLVIIDGIPGSIANITAEDVESISVLKDAASASIYGSRAAAGVILITTKRAKAGQLLLDYNYEYGIDKPTGRPEYADAVGYMKVANEVKWNDNFNTGSEYTIYAKDLIDNYPALHAENPDLYPDTDWLGLMLKKSAPHQNHQLSLTAGTDRIRTMVSMSYTDAETVQLGRSFKRTSIRANNDITINEFLSATVNLSYLHSLAEQTKKNLTLYVGSYGTAVYPALWSDGRIAEGQTAYNPYAEIVHGGFNHYWTDRFQAKIALDLKPLEGLTLSAILSPSISESKRKEFVKKVPYTLWNEPNVIVGYIRGCTDTNLTEIRGEGNSRTVQFLANYLRTFGNHDINLMAGYEDYYGFSESMEGYSSHFNLNTYPYLSLGNKNYLDNTGTAYENAYRSFFGRAIYNYGDKYLLQANARYDGSSRFHKDNRWGLFPSFSAGWVISNEPFMKNTPVLSYLKLRASWGSLGNDRIGNYPYQSTISFASNLLYLGSKISSVQNASIPNYAIENISWETTETIDVGVDVNLFDNKLQITGDYYNKKTRDMLLAIQIPIYIGQTNPDQNTGIMTTKGWDFEAKYVNHSTKDFNYSIAFNLSDYRSVMGDLGGTEFLGNQVKFEGSEFNEWFGYLSDGLFQTKEEAAASPKVSSSVTAGDVKYKDISGPDGKPDNKITPEYDRVLLGGSLPRYQFGATFQLNYKNLDFSLVLQGIGKQKAWLREQMVYYTYNDVPDYFMGNYWSLYNTAEKNLKAKYPRVTSYSTNNWVMSDYWLFDGSYLRFKNLTLGYTLPKGLSEKLKTQNVRFYATLSDFLSFDKYPPGWDPETTPSTYWITSSFIFGISLKF